MNGPSRRAQRREEYDKVLGACGVVLLVMVLVAGVFA